MASPFKNSDTAHNRNSPGLFPAENQKTAEEAVKSLKQTPDVVVGEPVTYRFECGKTIVVVPYKKKPV